MYGTKAAFDYIVVGGRCAYETNKTFEFPTQSFYATSSLYTTEHDGIRCDFMDTNSYLEVLFDEAIDGDKFYMLQLVYYVKNVDTLNLKITWKKEGAVVFCNECYENIILETSGDKFLYANIDLRQNSEWVGKITNLRIGVYNTEVVPLFIKYFSVYSPTTYKCTKPACCYYSKYKHPCDGGKDLHIILGKYFDGNAVSLVSDSTFLFSVYDVDFVIEFESNCYFLDTVLSRLNTFFDSMSLPCLRIIKDSGKIKLSCDYVKPIIQHTELSEKLGFFNSDGSESNVYTIENSGASDYIDVAGNLKGIYEVSNLGDLDFSKLFSIGFSDDKDFYPESTFEFSNQTVIFYTLVVPFDGYLNCFEIYCKVFSGGGKILIYRRNGDIYEVVDSYSLTETPFMSKHVIDWICRVYKGDVIGVYNLKLGISKKTTDPINYYGVTSGYSSSIDKINFENISFSSVSIYAFLKQPTTNDIPITAFYNEASYVDTLSFLLEYGDDDADYFNIIFNNVFNCEIIGCQINVKDIVGVVTEVPGAVSNIACLSDSVFSDVNDKIQIELDSTPPIGLSTIDGRGVLTYSWDSYVTDIYETYDCTYTFIPGSVFFYYEFPSIIDINKVLIYSTEEEVVDKYLLKILDNTKQSPTFSNPNDVIILDSQINNWEFNIDNNETKGVGIFVYNYGELPNINFSEIELYTRVGSIPKYIVEVVGITHDDYTVFFDLDAVGYKNDFCVGNHIKSLTLNINFIVSDNFLNFENINIYSSYLPDDYFISKSEAGEGTLTVYNTRSKALKCYLLDYNINLLDNLIYEYDFDNEVLHKGFVPTRYTHPQFYFTSGNYINNEYTTYSLNNMLNLEEFFVIKTYQFSSHEYDDWYAPYDYLVPGHDGEFVYIDGGLKLRPLMSEALRWFNYINVNEFYNDIDIELIFDYVGNVEDFVFIGVTCCDRNYSNYLKFYGAFQTSSEYGLEFKLAGDVEPTYYNFASILGRNAGLRIKKVGNNWTFYCFYSDEWHELTTFSLFDTEILISISTLFNAPHVAGNVIANFKSCEIKASKIISGKKVWYTINDGLSYVYSGHVLDDSIILDNFNKSLTFCRDYTIKKFIYDFNATAAKYLKFVNTSSKSIKITEIKCYLNGTLVPIKQGYVSYSDDLFFGTLTGETSYLDDDVIINYDLSNSILKGGDAVLSSVGVELDNVLGVDNVVLYYVSETGLYEPCRLMYSYDNVTYFDVYDNFSLFSKNSNTTVHSLFNEFVGYKGKNEIIYDFVSNDQYSTDFSEEGLLTYKWSISSPNVVDSGGVWLALITGPESLYSKFSIDGDFIIDMYFDSFSNYSSGDARVYLKVIFRNNTYYNDVYIYYDFDSNQVYTRDGGLSIESGRTSSGLRIKRVGSIFYFYYRRYGTTWYEVNSHDYGYDYIYPVDVYVYLTGSNSFDLRIKKVLITEGTGIADTDFELLESPGLSTLFVCGRQFSNNDTYAFATRWSMTELFYPFSFSLLHSVVSSIPVGGFLVEKPYSLYLTYESKDLVLGWFSDYFTEYKIDNVLSYSSIINTISSVSVDNYNGDNTLFTGTSDPTVKAIYKSKYDVNTIIDETFKTGEGTFDKALVDDILARPGYLFDGFNGDNGVKANSMYWATYDTIYGTARVQDDILFFSFSEPNYRDTFDGNDGDSPNPGFWSISYSGDAISPQILSNKLQLYLGGSNSGWAYAKNVNKFVGDFDIQVDYELASGYINQKGGWGCLRFEAGGKDIRICRSRDQTYDSYNGYRVLIDGSYSAFYSKSSDYTGKLRLRRSGSNIYCYFWMNSDWYHLETVAVPTNDADISLYVSNYSDYPKLDFRFNNFNVEYFNIKSTYNVFGDFDTQTTFSGLAGMDTTGCGLEIKFQIEDSCVYMKAGYDDYGGGDGKYFLTDIKIDNIWQGYNRALRVNNYGKIRIARTNNNVTVYYKDGNELNWTEFHTFSSFLVDKGRVILGLWSANSLNPSGYFDNFVFTTTSGDASCQPSKLEDDFTAVSGSLANTDYWTTYDTSRGTVRIQNNSLNFSFVK